MNPEDDPRFRQYWEAYHRLMARNGVTVEAAKAAVRRSSTIIAALMVHLGDADAMLCGTLGRFDQHLEHLRPLPAVKGRRYTMPKWRTQLVRRGGKSSSSA